MSPHTASTLPELFRARVAVSGSQAAYREYIAGTDSWRSVRWDDVAERVGIWQAALAASGLVAGDRVGLMLKNSVDWVVFDQAALSLGLVTVPLYLDDRPDNAAWIINHAGIRLLLIEGRFQQRKIADLLAHTPDLATIVSLTPPDAALCAYSERVIAAEAWLARGAGGAPDLPPLAGDLLASIVYTSGTTGRPKGVMLTHANMLTNARAGANSVAFGPDELFLSFLPLSHMFERTAGYYMAMMIGAEVAFSRGATQLAQDMQTVRPTVLISVPRIYERIYARLQDSLAEKSVVTRAVFALAVRTGWRHFEYRQQRAGWRPSLLLWPWLEKKVAHPLQARLGGRLRYAVSGGAAITREIAETFVGLGIPLYQGYGLTETSPVISVNRVESNIPTSIGLPLDGVAVRLAPDGELLTRSACVMRGYWQDEAATRAMIDADGWLHTGDLARQDARGHYHIIGRSKDIIVLSNGEKVPPVDMEAAITLDPLFAQALVIGEGRPYLVALVVVDSEHWAAFATHHGLPADPARFADPKVMKALLTQLGRQLKAFPGYAQIRRILPLTDPWTVENDLLTPTLKTKRATLLSHYAKAIDNLYQ